MTITRGRGNVGTWCCLAKVPRATTLPEAQLQMQLRVIYTGTLRQRFVGDAIAQAPRVADAVSAVCICTDLNFRSGHPRYQYSAVRYVPVGRFRARTRPMAREFRLTLRSAFAMRPGIVTVIIILTRDCCINEHESHAFLSHLHILELLTDYRSSLVPVYYYIR